METTTTEATPATAPTVSWTTGNQNDPPGRVNRGDDRVDLTLSERSRHGQRDPDDLATQAYAVRAVKTCTFWRDHAKTWFNQLEAKFRAHNVRSDDLKFCLVVDNLDKESMLEVADIIESPPSADKYTRLKETLITRLTDSDEKRWKKLLTDTIGDRKPSHLLREMRRLTGGTVDEQLLQALWLQRMPLRVQEILSVVEGVPLEKLAELADKAIERIPTTATSVQATATEQMTGATASSAIEKLTQQVQDLLTN